MRKKIASTVIAVFVGFATWATPKYFEVNNMITQQNSYWLLDAIYIGVFIVICVLMWGYWSTIQPAFNNIGGAISKLASLDLRSPIYYNPTKKKTKRNEDITFYSKSAIETTASELAEIVLFTKDFQATIERLDKNASSNYIYSVPCILQNVCGLINDKMSTLILLNQDRNLLLKEYERLEMDFHSLKTEIDGFTNMIPINQRQKVSLSLRQLIFGYCDSISEFGAFLTGLRQQGIQPIWESEQWTKTTYPTLIKDFNSLTELLKTLRKDAPKNLQSCFPDDRSIKTFAELVPDKGGSQS